MLLSIHMPPNGLHCVHDGKGATGSVAFLTSSCKSTGKTLLCGPFQSCFRLASLFFILTGKEVARWCDILFVYFGGFVCLFLGFGTLKEHDEKSRSLFSNTISGFSAPPAPLHIFLSCSVLASANIVRPSPISL